MTLDPKFLHLHTRGSFHLFASWSVVYILSLLLSLSLSLSPYMCVNESFNIVFWTLFSLLSPNFIVTYHVWVPFQTTTILNLHIVSFLIFKLMAQFKATTWFQIVIAETEYQRDTQIFSLSSNSMGNKLLYLDYIFEDLLVVW